MAELYTQPQLLDQTWAAFQGFLQGSRILAPPGQPRPSPGLPPVASSPLLARNAVPLGQTPYLGVYRAYSAFHPFRPRTLAGVASTLIHE